MEDIRNMIDNLLAKFDTGDEFKVFSPSVKAERSDTEESKADPEVLKIYQMYVDLGLKVDELLEAAQKKRFLEGQRLEEEAIEGDIIITGESNETNMANQRGEYPDGGGVVANRVNSHTSISTTSSTLTAGSSGIDGKRGMVVLDETAGASSSVNLGEAPPSGSAKKSVDAFWANWSGDKLSKELQAWHTNVRVDEDDLLSVVTSKMEESLKEQYVEAGRQGWRSNSVVNLPVIWSPRKLNPTAATDSPDGQPQSNAVAQSESLVRPEMCAPPRMESVNKQKDGGTQIDTVAGSRNVQAKASVAAADSFDDLKRPAVDRFEDNSTDIADIDFNSATLIRVGAPSRAPSVLSSASDLPTKPFGRGRPIVPP